MLVKKKDSEWKPAENQDLKVGETIDITNPKDLILSGKVVAVKKDGTEISAYELYGVITVDERKDFEEYLKVKKQGLLKDQLEKEQQQLKTAVAETTSEKTTTATELNELEALKTAAKKK